MEADASAARRPGWAGAAAVSLPLLLAAIFLLLSPLLQLGFSRYPLNDQRSAQVVVIVLAQLSLLYLIFARLYSAPLPKPAWFCLLGFIAFGVLSGSILRENKLEAFGEVALWVGLGSLAALTAQVVTRYRADALRWIGNVALCLAAIYVFGVAARILASIHLGKDIDVYVFLLSGYTNPRFPSTTLALLSVLALLNSNGTVRSVLLPFALASLVWAIQLGLGTRAAWVATGLALLALTLLVGIRRSARLHLFTLASMGLGSLIFFGLIAAGRLWNSGLGMLGRIKDLATPNLRDVLWAKCIEYIASAPLFGIGPMQFAANQQNQFAHPHNWLLQVAAEWGLPAAGLLCTAGYLVWRASYDQLTARPTGGAVDVLLLGSLVALFYGLLDGNYVMPISQTAVALTFGALVGALSVGQSNTGMVGHSVPLVAVLVLSSATLGAMTLATATCQSNAVEQLIQLQGFANLAPRFWLDGWVPFCR